MFLPFFYKLGFGIELTTKADLPLKNQLNHTILSSSSQVKKKWILRVTLHQNEPKRFTVSSAQRQQLDSRQISSMNTWGLFL